jgi:hypothetical protein
MQFGPVGAMKEIGWSKARWWSMLTSPLYQILIVLKKIEYHLSIATDTNLKDQDVDT